MEYHTEPHSSSTQPIIASPEADTHDTEHAERKEGFLAEIIRFSLIALIVVLPIRMFVAQPFIVSGASMETTFSTGQYLIIDQLTYHFNAPKRGDVVVFRYPKDTSKFFIKRIIGIPGDSIDIAGNVVTISNTTDTKGTVLDEPYVFSMAPNTSLKETLGSTEYFVMGDNRDASSDSRMWGVLPREDIVGRVYLRLFPLSSIGLFPGNYDINAEIINTPT